jgi:hypothetical protein
MVKPSSTLCEWRKEVVVSESFGFELGTGLELGCDGVVYRRSHDGRANQWSHSKEW